MTTTSAIRIERLSSASEIAALADAWNALAARVPFRSFQWLESWWRSYGAGPGKELFVLAAFNESSELVALAPWYLERNSRRGAAVRFLGSGEVCSDYLSILCRRDDREQATLALADWLSSASCSAGTSRASWDLIELCGIDRDDLTVNRLLDRMADRGQLVHRRTRASCWRVHLPSNWDTYLGMLSKSHRKQIRRLDRRYFDSGRAQLRVAADEETLERGLNLLVGLHQRRRESRGERGCFVSERFAEFHRASARRLLASGNLRLVWLEVDGRPVAVEYQVLGDRSVYAYQSGIDPEALDHEPGRLITMATLKMAIAEGRRAFDFLRGDELYKAHWRATPRATQDIRLIPDARAARLRHQVWLAGSSLKDWLRDGLTRSGVALN